MMKYQLTTLWVFRLSPQANCMNAKIKLVLAVVLALCFLGLSIGALEVVPKYIEDRYYVMGVEGKWSNLVSLLFYVMAVMCGFYGWLVFRHIKYKRRYG